MSKDEQNHEPMATESVIAALHKVIRLLDGIKGAIEMSSSKIPRAAVQLNTVTQATEIATVEILNVLDEVTQKVSRIETGFEVLSGAALTPEQQATLSAIRQTVAEVKTDTMNITIALQVQDITAQKIAAANHLIESVRVELERELIHFESAKKKVEPEANRNEAENPHAKPFDLDASYMKAPDLQAKIDEVIDAFQAKKKT